ncbi:hypothetical protein PoB_005253200 [Plakobranchus ocellatus]|uniref:Uncharacterized protein n=1 Tax=Plakobranchus ocellatus TaxID=259542 RepID=A0AAV4C434_9GAST|nr:hypothetical protein PoB_005253200 [Plakobranchus ocellatus]
MRLKLAPMMGGYDRESVRGVVLLAVYLQKTECGPSPMATITCGSHRQRVCRWTSEQRKDQATGTTNSVGRLASPATRHRRALECGAVI